MTNSQPTLMREIVNSLLARTREGKINWAWDEHQATGIAMLSSGRVIVSKDDDSDTQLVVQDSRRNVLESMNVGYPRYKSLKLQADTLYELARRSALNIDSKVESILREISG